MSMINVSERCVFVPLRGDGGGSRKNDDRFPFFRDVELVKQSLTAESFNMWSQNLVSKNIHR